MPSRVEEGAGAVRTDDDGGGAIGVRLRVERERQRLSLRELARRIGLSPSAVSQIERGHVMPSVGTLYSITSQLGLSMDELFADAPEEPAADGGAVLGAAVALAAPPPEIALGVRSPARGQVHRRARRSAITLASGVRWELLTGYEHGVEFLYVVYPVGSESCEPDNPIRHGGTERGVVLRGRLGVTLGTQDHELRAGDSIAFHSDVPHRLWAIGGQAAEAVWFVVGRNGDRR